MTLYRLFVTLAEAVEFAEAAPEPVEVWQHTSPDQYRDVVYLTRPVSAPPALPIETIVRVWPVA